MPLEDDFWDILKKARVGQGLGVDDVANRSGLRTQDLSLLERGKRLPSKAEIQALAAALKLRAKPLVDIALFGWEPTPVPAELPGVERICGEMGGYAVNGYVLYDGGEAILIDTAYHADAMLDALRRRNLRLTAVCLTHGHVDHAGGLNRILLKWEVPVYLGEADVDFLKWQPPADRLVVVPSGESERQIQVGGLTVQFLATPGHTRGGLCFLVERDHDPVCFVGDTLFAGSIGRANPFSLYFLHLDSVRGQLLTLPDSTRLFPGHGPATTVAEERQHNPFAAEA
ncbi:MAG: MBL fold metallo-hydrolase [Nitrospirales bacterium]